MDCFTLYLFIYLAVPYGMWDLSSPTRDRTQAMTVKAQSPNHCVTRKVLLFLLRMVLFFSPSFFF